MWTAASGTRRTAGYVIALVGTALLVIVLLGFRGAVEPLSIGWAFLAWVIVSAAVGGLGPGVVASVAAFLAFNYFFIPPYDTFRIDDPEHVVVLFVFLGLSTLISALLARADARAEAADDRRRELQLQQDLARALVEPTAGDDNYRMVLHLLRSRLRCRSASLLAQTDDGLREVVAVGAAPSTDGSGSVERIPLVVGRRSLGVLVLSGRPEPLHPAERRTVEAFGDQLALVMERDRVLRAAVDAEVARRSG